jgi:NADH dehydrogenase [ubiquinone] 1 alpha subcomplex assembly factor 3
MGSDFDMAKFKRQWDSLEPPAHDLFDRKMKIYGLQDNFFLVNHYWIPGSVIVFPNRFFMWNVQDASEIKPHTLEILSYVKPRPDYVIIGTGDEYVQFDQSFYDHFKRLGMSVDTCQTFEATSTFNMCMEDDYNVACCLLRPKVSDAAGLSP